MFCTFVLIFSCFWFDFVDFVFGLSNVAMGCGGRPVIVGWCYVYSSTEKAEQREEMRVMSELQGKGQSREIRCEE